MTNTNTWWDECSDGDDGFYWRACTVLAPAARADLCVQADLVCDCEAVCACAYSEVHITVLLPHKEARLTVEAARELRDALDHALGLATAATA